MKIIKYFLLFVLRLVILSVTAGYIIASYYGDEIKNRIVGELNKHITIDIKVDFVDFSVYTFIEDFPNVSLDFRNVTALSSRSFNGRQFDVNTDTLMTAKKLSLQFNIRDIWRGNYSISNINAEDGILNIFMDSRNYGNYHFWEDDTSDTNSGIELNINDLRLEDMDFRYINLYAAQKGETYIERLKLSGNFSSDRYTLASKADLFIRSMYFDKVNYIDNHKVEAELEMNVDGERYMIEEAMLRIAGMPFNVGGSIYDGKDTELDLSVKGQDLDIRSFLSLLPEDYQKYTNDYESSGDFYFET
ncbi:MAG: hypothetical protein KJ607_13955, partial [Bacteroidetes bacterium]|nr:hypothetical protein [Bacteroidota bacterium]